MRIDTLRLTNFKQFEHQEVHLHPKFNVLVGVNGAGKTSILDALAVAASVWLVEPPQSTLSSSSRNIAVSEVRLREEKRGDRIQFREVKPVVVEAVGSLDGAAPIKWVRQIRETGQRTTNADARAAIQAVKKLYRLDAQGTVSNFPVLAYYGAGRAWLSSTERSPSPKGDSRALRWSGFYDCFNERIRIAQVKKWFKNEFIERGNLRGDWRLGFNAVKHAVVSCIPDADDLWFDSDRDQVILSISGKAQPFDNLSAGQHMMLAMVADIAIRAVKQNSILLEEKFQTTEGYRVLTESTGLVLIDELDVHLHPQWQRRIVSDLTRVFPSIQFVCTSHSPQVIGEVPPEQVLLVGAESVARPLHSFGLKTDEILESIMETKPRTDVVQTQFDKLYQQLDNADEAGARESIGLIEKSIGTNNPDLTYAETLLSLRSDSAEAES